MNTNYIKYDRILPNNSKCLALFQNHNSTTSRKLIIFADVVEMAANPQCVLKQNAYALAPQLSGVKTKAEIIDWNEMTCLWIDIDSGNQTLEAIKQELKTAGLSLFLIYATHSATPDDKRWRVLIPLSNPLPCNKWCDVQEALQIIMDGDTSATRIQQILYAPNKGKFYQYAYVDGEPLTAIPAPIQSIIDDLKAKRKAVHQRISNKLAARPTIGNGFTIADANNALDTQVMLKLYGYKRRGRKWLSPNSASGTPGLIAFADGRWFSHHSGDVGIGLSVDNSVCGDAFDLYCYYEHGGDSRKGLAKLCASLDPDGQKRRQFEYMKAKEAA